MNLQELKKRIRKLRKIKKDLRVGSQDRKDMNKTLRELKQEYQEKSVPTGEKDEVIIELERVYKTKGKPIVIDFRDFTLDELKFHLDRVKGG